MSLTTLPKSSGLEEKIIGLEENSSLMS